MISMAITRVVNNGPPTSQLDLIDHQASPPDGFKTFFGSHRFLVYVNGDDRERYQHDG